VKLATHLHRIFLATRIYHTVLDHRDKLTLQSNSLTVSSLVVSDTRVMKQRQKRGILPLLTKSMTVNLPMPVFEPVTIAVFPSSRAVPSYIEQPTIVTRLMSLTVWRLCGSGHGLQTMLCALQGAHRHGENTRGPPQNYAASLSHKLHVALQITDITSVLVFIFVPSLQTLHK
jgi:hypothetical protein